MTPRDIASALDPAEVAAACDAWAQTYDDEYAGRPETAAEDALVTSWLRAAIAPGSAVLDLGCGTGWLLDVLPWPRALYYGMDVSPGMVERSRAKHPGWSFDVGSITDPWPLFPHDWRGETPRVAVAMWSVLNHLDPSGLRRTFHSLMESDADVLYAIVRTPVAPSPLGLSEPGEIASPVARVIAPVSLRDIEEAALPLGLEIADVRGFLDGGTAVLPEHAHYLWVEVR